MAVPGQHRVVAPEHHQARLPRRLDQHLAGPGLAHVDLDGDLGVLRAQVRQDLLDRGAQPLGPAVVLGEPHRVVDVRRRIPPAADHREHGTTVACGVERLAEHRHALLGVVDPDDDVGRRVVVDPLVGHRHDRDVHPGGDASGHRPHVGVGEPGVRAPADHDQRRVVGRGVDRGHRRGPRERRGHRDQAPDDRRRMPHGGPEDVARGVLQRGQAGVVGMLAGRRHVHAVHEVQAAALPQGLGGSEVDRRARTPRTDRDDEGSRRGEHRDSDLSPPPSGTSDPGP
jgi:hypothetical protein